MLTVIGESLVDVVHSDTAAPRSYVGGSPMNVAVGLARLGHPAQFIGRYGADAHGEMVVSHLRENDVLTPLPPDQHPTSVATATLGPTGAAHYVFDLVWDLPGLDRKLPTFLQGTTMLHTGSIAAMLVPGSDAVLAAVEAARPLATISYDPNCRPTIISDVDYARAQAEKFVALADVVKASDEDLQWLYPDVTVEQAARDWQRLGPGLVVVTRGSAGPWAVAEAGEVEVPAPSVSVVDTVGAGDSFMSALLGTLVDRELDGAQRRDQLRGLSREQITGILEYAASAAAVTVSRAGSNLPFAAELSN